MGGDGLGRERGKEGGREGKVVSGSYTLWMDHTEV